MSDEWKLNGEGGSPDNRNLEEEQRDLQKETAVDDNITGTENLAEEPVEQAEEPEEPEEPVSGEPGSATYHWVNPEYQKRQQGTAEVPPNTYETDSYRENIGGAANSQNQGYSNQIPHNSGYQGGSYHSGWNSGNTQNYSAQGPAAGQRRYGAYQFSQENPVKSPKKKKSMGTGKKLLVTAGMAAVFGLIAGGVMFGVNTLGNHLTGQDEIPQTQMQIPSADTPEPKSGSEFVSNESSGGFTVSEVAKSCMPSVVSITNASVKTVQDFFGGVQEYPIESTGSGIIVGQNDDELLIATNNHVVAEANTISVAFSDDAICEAQTKGTDADNDLAVIAVKLGDMSQETLNSIKIVTLGDSDSLEVGEQVVAIGNALGYGQSVTSGWVSAVNREVTDAEGKTSGKLIQTDAAINPGNSGGALLNMRGELIGINSAKAAATEVEGMGYAIPITTAHPILDELMNRETRYKVDGDSSAYIGVTCMNVEATAAQMYGIPLGAFVDTVEEGGPAAAAGIQKGDVIIKFDGLSISGSKELVNKLQYYEAGEEIEVVISRAENGEYKEQTLTVTLGRKSDMTQEVQR